MKLKEVLPKYQGQLIQIGAFTNFLYVDICGADTVEYLKNAKVKKGAIPYLAREVREIYPNYAGTVILIEGDETGKYWLHQEFLAEKGKNVKNYRVNTVSDMIWLEYKGKRHTLSGWATVLDLPKHVVRNRYKAGWTVDEIINTPLGKKRSKK